MKKNVDNYTILNRMVETAAVIMANKAENLRLLGTLFKEKNTPDGDATASKLMQDAEAIDGAVELMNRLGGCWT
jgi:hypothetical protein